MVKFSVLIAVFLGVVFAPLIPADDDVINFDWKNGDDYVHMRVVKPIDKIDQRWIIGGGVKIKLSYQQGKTLEQSWDFGETKYTYYNNSGKWENGKEDAAAMQKCKSWIDQWCNEHQKQMLGDTKCIIY